MTINHFYEATAGKSKKIVANYGHQRIWKISIGHAAEDRRKLWIFCLINEGRYSAYSVGFYCIYCRVA
jgi:hypothetical protein